MDKKNIAIITAAGKGIRLKKDIKKQYIKLKEKPIIYYTIKKFNDFNIIDEIIVVADKENIEYMKKEVIEKYNFHKVKTIVEGGKTRKESVYNGFKKIENKNSIIIIHDGVRPFVENKVIFNSVKNASLYGASIAAVKSIDTVKIVEDEMVIDTLDRDKLRRVQTPQAFKYEILEESYKLVDRNSSKITDEAFIVESAGFPVHITESSEKNIKITTEFDLELAVFLLKKESLRKLE